MTDHPERMTPLSEISTDEMRAAISAGLLAGPTASAVDGILICPLCIKPVGAYFVIGSGPACEHPPGEECPPGLTILQWNTLRDHHDPSCPEVAVLDELRRRRTEADGE